MAKINKLRCALCGGEHNYSIVTELAAKGWFVDGVSKTGVAARRLICPHCLERILGRKPSPDEFTMPE